VTVKSETWHGTGAIVADLVDVGPNTPVTTET
jgi:acetyltransferase-like isoleucine patch superfamily enzyme